MDKISALKFIDKAILPAVLLVAGKVLTIFLLALVFSVPWSFNSINGNYGFFFINFANSNDAFFLNNLSDFVMLLTVSVGFLWTIFRGSHFREDRLHPITTARLHKSGREGLIIKQRAALTEGLVWLSLSWVVLFLILNNCLQGYTSQVVFGFAAVATLGLTITLFEAFRD